MMTTLMLGSERQVRVRVCVLTFTPPAADCFGSTCNGATSFAISHNSKARAESASPGSVSIVP